MIIPSGRTGAHVTHSGATATDLAQFVRSCAWHRCGMDVFHKQKPSKINDLKRDVNYGRITANKAAFGLALGERDL